MGGSFFTSGPDALSTPRMPPLVYHETKARVHRALLDLYLCVASPIDGPAKADFGDVDIVVTWNRQATLGLAPPFNTVNGEGDAEFLQISRALGAERMTVEKGTRAAHLAIPWPSHLQHLGSQGEDGGERYIQVDVRICDSLPTLQWFLFKHAHGDLWNIIGSTIRPLGLTVDESALWIRVPEIENINRKRAKVKVTDDPVQVLRVLGLEWGSFWEEPFGSVEGLYEYAATSSMFWVRPLGEDDETTTAEDRRALKANDRRRMDMRPVYRGWVEDFLPRYRREKRLPEQLHTRDSVTSLIFSLFPVQGEFEARRRDFEIEEQRNDIWKNKIKGFVAGLGDVEGEGARGQTYRGCLAKALKRIVLEGDTRYDVFPEKTMRGEDGRYVMGNVEEFIENSWRAVGEAAMRANDEAYLESLRLGKGKGKGQGGMEGGNEGIG